MTNKEINAAYIGSEQVDKIYLGEDLVYGGGEPEPIYSAMPLTFEVISAGTINFRKSTSTAPTRAVRYTMDDGETWTTITATTGTGNAIQVQPGDKVQFYGLNTSYATSISAYDTFFGAGTYASTATVKVYGNIMSLVKGDDFTTATTLSGSINSMFRGAGDKLVDASHLILPATTLHLRSYSYMFYNCTSLTTAPELPATTLAQECYSYMFSGCTSLTTAPALPATTLAQNCYDAMFKGCTSLTTAPALSATTVPLNSYRQMFADCTSLVSAGDIYADTFATGGTKNTYQPGATDGPISGTPGNSACNAMFAGCTSLTTPPAIHSTTAPGAWSFQCMFSGCTSLEETPEMDFAATSSGCCHNMFNTCTSLTSVPSMPSGTGYWSFVNMFKHCTSLTDAPVLSATTLGERCYSGMFSNSGLVYAPVLPATTLNVHCYSWMFENCTHLTDAPVLSATTLADYCYQSMFAGCTSLTSAPALPATALTNTCYFGMFSNCTSLTAAPELPATTLVQNCYRIMFSGCTSLDNITCLATNISATDCLNYWVDGVAASGTFYKNPAMSSWPTGGSGIPSGWTVQDAT